MCCSPRGLKEFDMTERLKNHHTVSLKDAAAIGIKVQPSLCCTRTFVHRQKVEAESSIGTTKYIKMLCI